MTTQTKHTPLPFSISGIAGDNNLMARVGDRKRTIAILIGELELSPEEFEANKQFVQLACNAHYQLVEALKECITHDGAVAWRNAEFAGRRLEAISNIARQALALAEKGRE